MADRRPDEGSPPTAPFQPVPGQPHESSPFQGRVTEEHRPITERINAAYASSAPIVPDEPEAREGTEPDASDEPDTREGPDQLEEAAGEPPKAARPTGAERFAAVLAATTGRGPAAPVAGPTGNPAGTAPGAPSAPPGSGSGATPAPVQPAAASAAPAQPVAEQPTTPSGRPSPRRTRRARLRLTHIDPWSVMKTSFLLAVALGIVLVVAVAVVWTVLGAAGVWNSINSTVGDVLGDSGSGFQVEDYLGMSRVMGFTMIVAVVDVVLITVIATLGAFLYNLAATLLGGVEVVFAEDDR